MALSVKGLLRCFSKKKIENSTKVLIKQFKKNKNTEISKKFLYESLLEFKNQQLQVIKSGVFFKFRNYKKYSPYRIFKLIKNKYNWYLLLILNIKNYKELMFVKKLVKNMNILTSIKSSRSR